MGFKSDIEIAQEAVVQDIREIAKKLNLTEEDIRNEDKYDSYLSWYKGDFKKFLKLFKKERRKFKSK